MHQIGGILIFDGFVSRHLCRSVIITLLWRGVICAMDVRTQCLGLLMRGPASGYALKRLIENGPFCHFLEASFAAIYPALARLTADGLVSVTEEAQDRRPQKKVYAVTPAGREAFVAALSGPIEDDHFRSPWLVALYFADLLPPERVKTLIAERKDYCLRQIALISEARASAETPGARYAAEMGLAVFRAEFAYLTQTPVPGSADANPPLARQRKSPNPHLSAAVSVLHDV
ncbi:MAG TPA: hypothetical protein DCL54_13100 [Alphaproteobacteria bacterium]|nr:hypothetical protein [Alphaproteobacteria bacterium]HAJ47506.1 hypothetical protein [Alphaproteobacteria bacterium]